jgi:hypothetical protein
MAGGVEGRDHRCRVGEERRDGDARRQRLVEVEHVEAAPTQRSHRAHGGRRLGRHGRDGPVYAEAERAPGAGPAKVARQPARRDDLDVVSETRECPGQTDDLVLHPPGADRLYGHTRATRTCSPDTCRRRPRGQMSASRARSPSPTTRTFARSSGPKRLSSSGVIAVRNVPKARSASGSRKLRLVPSATWWMK